MVGFVYLPRVRMGWSWGSRPRVCFGRLGNGNDTSFRRHGHCNRQYAMLTALYVFYGSRFVSAGYYMLHQTLHEIKAKTPSHPGLLFQNKKLNPIMHPVTIPVVCRREPCQRHLLRPVPAIAKI